MFGASAHLYTLRGHLLLTLRNDTASQQMYSFTFAVENPSEHQPVQDTFLRALDPLALTLFEQTDSGLDRHAPLLVIDFAVRDIAQSSPLPSRNNTLSVTFAVTSDITSNATAPQTMLVLQILGLVETSSESDDDFRAIRSTNAPIHSAIWHAGTGGLYLRLNGDLMAQKLYVFSFDVTNRQGAQSAVIPTIAIGKLVESSSGGGDGSAPTFSTDLLLPPVHMSVAEDDTAPLKVFANLTVLRIGQSTASGGASNTITVTIASHNGLTLDSTTPLFLTGLTGSATLTGTRRVVSTDGSKLADNDAAWYQHNGTLVCKFLRNVTLQPGEELVFNFTLQNPTFSQPSPQVSIFITQLAPFWSPMESAHGLLAPLAVAGFVRSLLLQSSASQGVANTLTADLTLQTSLPADSYIVISGLMGAETVDGNVPVSVSHYNASLEEPWQSLEGEASPFNSLGTWNQTLGELRVQLVADLPDPLARYSLKWNLTNPNVAQPMPVNILIWGEGLVRMWRKTPVLGEGAAAPLLVGGFRTVALSQSQVSIESLNTLTLQLSTREAGLVAGTLVTVAGLVGGRPDSCGGLAKCVIPVSPSPMTSDDVWWEYGTLYMPGSGEDPHLVLEVLRDTDQNVDYTFQFEIRNGGAAQISPDISISACCKTVLVSIPVQHANPQDYNSAPLLIAGSPSSNMTQSTAGQGQHNTLTIDISFLVTLKPIADAQDATDVVLSGLVGSTTPSWSSTDETEAFAVDCSNQKLVGKGWKRSSKRGELTLQVKKIISAHQVIRCSFNLTNPLEAQEAPRVLAQLRGAMVGEPFVVKTVGEPEEAPLFVHGFTHASISQTTPSAGEINELFVSLESLGSLQAGAAITVHGLRHVLTSSTSTLSIMRNASTSPFEASGVWNQSTGTLIVALSTRLTAKQESGFSFALRNAIRGQDSAQIDVEVAGLVARAPVSTGPGNLAALLIADMPMRAIAQSQPAISASNTVSVTISSRADILPGSMILISGLRGSETPDSHSLALRGDSQAVGTLGSQALWLQARLSNGAPLRSCIRVPSLFCLLFASSLLFCDSAASSQGTHARTHARSHLQWFGASQQPSGSLGSDACFLVLLCRGRGFSSWSRSSSQEQPTVLPMLAPASALLVVPCLLISRCKTLAKVKSLLPSQLNLVSSIATFSSICPKTCTPRKMLGHT